jgi:cytosine/uracil/thiamine/allantoin permease
MANVLEPSGAAIDERIVVGASVVLLCMVWFLAKRGPSTMEKLSRICAPLQILVGLLIFGLLVAKFGATVWRIDGSHGAVTADPLSEIAFGVEFGFDNALSLLPFLGGLTRLVRHKRHLVGPTVVGSGIVGASLIATVAALAGALLGDTDPIVWIVKLAGPTLGPAFIGFLLIANIGTMVVQVYVAGVVVQQVRRLAALPWAWVLALTLLPGLFVAFKTEWLLANVMTWLAYNGVMFVGLAGVLITDFFLARNQSLRVAHLFARPPEGDYWYWNGVNWIAMAVLCCSGAIYLFLFNPVNLQIHSAFRYLGAGIPAVLTGGLLYFVAMTIAKNLASVGSRISPKSTDSLRVGL